MTRKIRRTTYYDDSGKRKPILFCDSYDQFLSDILRLSEEGVSFKVDGRSIYNDRGEVMVNWLLQRNSGCMPPTSFRITQETKDWFAAQSEATGMTMTEVVEWLVEHCKSIPTYNNISAHDAFRLLHCPDCDEYDNCDERRMQQCDRYANYVHNRNNQRK